MSLLDTKKLLIITWLIIVLLIGLGVGYLLGVNGIGQKAQSPVQVPQQQNFGPGPQGGAPAGQPGGQNPMPNSGTQGQPNQPASQRGEPVNQQR